MNLYHDDSQTEERADYVTSAGALTGSLRLNLSEESGLLPSGGSSGEIWSGNSGHMGVLIGYYSVVVPPTARVIAEVTEVTARGRLELAAGVEGGGPYEYQWSRAGGVVSGATNGTYRVETVTTNDAGSYTVRVVNPAWSATSAGVAVIVKRIEQSIEIEAIADREYSTQSLTLAASASSGLSVSYRVASGPATVSGSTLSLTGVGTVVVVASQVGDRDYAGAEEVSKTFVVRQAGQTISFASIQDRSYTTNTITLSGSASSGLAVAFSVTSGPATLIGNTLTLTGAGTVSVTATQSGDAKYLAATPVTKTFAVRQGAQTITFAALADTAYSTNTITLVGSASSGLPVKRR